MIHPVILCGGGGTRLWPRSRVDRPKPFLPLIGSHSLFEQTLMRTSGSHVFAAPIVVAGRKHLDHVESQIQASIEARIIVEPEPKNTAPAIALAALRLPPEAVMLVCPSDHYIEENSAFVSAAESAATLAEQDWLVTFGIEATRPETGYGYIKRGESLGNGFRVANFVEKPDLETAEAFLSDGGYSWNGGIFAFRASTFLAELEKHRPQMMTALKESVSGGSEGGRIFRPEPDAFGGIKGNSIDYAVMEDTDRAAVVPVSMGWSDIGNWEALRDARKRDESGNTAKGRSELLDCTNVLVESDGPRVSAIGLEDVIIVVDGGEVLVTTTAGAQKVGTLKGPTSQ